ncbi:sigma D regulator [Shewanella sp. SR44-4]|jgi:regulator of sigma D|uniref:sigma D regulator n=1 Tax=unclassified Shewanella TaxID=196818 RepID=UPI000C33854A|nr:MULTISPECIES: sigma D regulator [unclassified Shewanella]MBB1364427.1 sigma D regulator [Shewanella sp. SR44-4]MBO1896430.1 sigma D regulator [Shewanella sp. BF02_Schw]PKH33893.1 sigma D regulator [Shewanella sp. ALD9]
MLTKLEKAEKRWGGSHNLIDQWLNHRRKLLIQYFIVAGLAPYSRSEKSLPSMDQVKQFCAQLVDYVSEGHFEVYNNVIKACEKFGETSIETANALLPLISESTDTALDFNDKYTDASDEQVLYQLDNDLSHLAQAMESRFELEDELLELLYQRLP